MADGRVLLGINIETGEKTLHQYERYLYHRAGDRRHGHVSARLSSLGTGSWPSPTARTAGSSGWTASPSTAPTPSMSASPSTPRSPSCSSTLQGVPRATCLLWEHTLDSDGKPCPNPRVIIPRRLIPHIADQAGGGGCAQLRGPHAPRHQRAPQLRHPGPHGHHSAGAGLAVATGGSPGLQ